MERTSLYSTRQAQFVNSNSLQVWIIHLVWYSDMGRVDLGISRSGGLAVRGFAGPHLESARTVQHRVSTFNERRRSERQSINLFMGKYVWSIARSVGRSPQAVRNFHTTVRWERERVLLLIIEWRTLFGASLHRGSHVEELISMHRRGGIVIASHPPTKPTS